MRTFIKIVIGVVAATLICTAVIVPAVIVMRMENAKESKIESLLVEN